MLAALRWRGLAQQLKPSPHCNINLVQVRLYAPYLVAEVTMAGGDMDMRQALGQGFRQMWVCFWLAEQ